MALGEGASRPRKMNEVVSVVSLRVSLGAMNTEKSKCRDRD